VVDGYELVHFELLVLESTAAQLEWAGIPCSCTLRRRDTVMLQKSSHAVQPVQLYGGGVISSRTLHTVKHGVHESSK